MYSQFPLFQSHLDLAHTLWKSLVTPKDTLIDATCGNGHDTLFLCQLGPNKIWALDLQKEAVLATQQLTHEFQDKVTLVEGCHSQFPAEIVSCSIKLIVYNLGYLPGGNKEMTTQVETTKLSLTKALDLLVPGGVISVTCYPGHFEGEKEQSVLLDWAKSLPPQTWSCTHHTWINRKKAPSLLLIQKSR